MRKKSGTYICDSPSKNDAKHTFGWHGEGQSSFRKQHVAWNKSVLIKQYAMLLSLLACCLAQDKSTYMQTHVVDANKESKCWYVKAADSLNGLSLADIEEC